MGYGQPKHVMESGDVQRQSLVFLGIKPWENDNMKEQTDRMIQQKADEERVRALEAAKPSVVIDVTKGDSDEVPETLEVVNPLPPEDPSAYR